MDLQLGVDILSSFLPSEFIPRTGAIFSSDRKYRYVLWRIWNSERPKVLFIMLNPSIADEVRDDPTQRRCRRYAQRWGFGGYYVGNIFAIVSTDPRRLKEVDDPVGTENNSYLQKLHTESASTVIAWGTWGNLHGRNIEVLSLLKKIKPVKCLGLCMDGNPKHPLYLKVGLVPMEYEMVEKVGMKISA